MENTTNVSLSIESFSVCAEMPSQSSRQSDYAGEVLLKKLMTPHISKERSSSGQQTVYDAINVEATCKNLADAELQGSSTLDGARIVEAQRIAHIVNEALKYVSWEDAARHKKPSPVLEPESLMHKQETNCFGYAIVASGCMDTVGITHHIGYMNGHAFILLPIGEEEPDGMWMIDPLVPSLSQELTGVVSGVSWSEVSAQMETYKRSAVYLNSKTMADRFGQNVVDFVQDYTWLTRVAPGQGTVRSTSGQLTTLPERHTKLVLNILSAAEGRKALTSALAFKNAKLVSDAPAALRALNDMSGFYPDIDARSKHTDILGLVRALCDLGDVAGAKEAVTAYFTSFVGSDDPRISVAEADCIRIIARVDPASLLDARKGYDAAAKRSQFPGYIRHVVAPKLALVSEVLTGRLDSRTEVNII